VTALAGFFWNSIALILILFLFHFIVFLQFEMLTFQFTTFLSGSKYVIEHIYMICLLAKSNYVTFKLCLVSEENTGVKNCSCLFSFLVEVFCDVISGDFNVTANGGNGQKGQDGGKGGRGGNSGDRVRTLFTTDITKYKCPTHF